MSVTRASTIFVLASWILKQLCDDIKLSSMFWPPLWEKMAATMSLPPPRNERQWSVNNFWSCIMDTQSTVHWDYPIINVSAAFMGNNASDDIITTSWKWASTELQQFFVLHLGQSKGYGKALTHNQHIGYLYRQKCDWQYRISLIQLSAHWASTILVGAQ